MAMPCKQIIASTLRAIEIKLIQEQPRVKAFDQAHLERLKPATEKTQPVVTNTFRG